MNKKQKKVLEKDKRGENVKLKKVLETKKRLKKIVSYKRNFWKTDKLEEALIIGRKNKAKKLINVG